MMTSQKPRLHKQPTCDDDELRISVKSLLFLAFIVLLFLVFAFIAVPQTYGFF